MEIFHERNKDHVQMLLDASPPLIRSCQRNEPAATSQKSKVLQLALLMDATESMSIWLKRAKD